MESKPRILIVEDTESWSEIFADALKKDDPIVKTARTLAEARRILERRSFDVAIVDIRLSEGNISNTDGMKVLEIIRDSGDATSIIVVSGYATVELTRDAFKRFEVFDFLEKDSFDEAEFMRLVEAGTRLARSTGYGNKSLIESVLKGSGITLKDLDSLPGTESDHEATARKTFMAIWPLATKPEPTSKLHETAEGEHFTQTVAWSKGYGEAVVVRFGSFDLIKRESHNFNDFVQTKDARGSDKRPTKMGPYYYGNILGGLVYILPDAEREPIRDFSTFYDEEDTPRILQVVDNLFQRTCYNLYSSRGIDTARVDLRSAYKSVIEKLHERRQNEKKEEAHYLAQMEEGDRTAYLQERELLAQLSVDPLEYVRARQFVFDCPVGVTHGDLRDGNILVDAQGQTWLVGFYNTGTSDVALGKDEPSETVAFRASQAGKRNLLHDFATLELSIRARLGSVDPAASLAFDKVLCEPNEFGESVSFAVPQSEPQLDKAYRVIARLRDLQSAIVDYNDDMQLYYSELLFQLLQSYQHQQGQSQKDRLWASAETIAARLAQWSSPSKS